MPARGFAIVVGSLFVLFGVLGFVPHLVVYPLPSPSSPHSILVEGGYGALFGIFPVNYVRDVVQIIIGLLGLAAAGSIPNARVWNRGVFFYCAAVLLLGILPWTRTFFGVMPIFGWNVGFHFMIAMLSYYFAFIYPLDCQQPELAR